MNKNRGSPETSAQQVAPVTKEPTPPETTEIEEDKTVNGKLDINIKEPSSNINNSNSTSASSHIKNDFRHNYH
jgi:hypothetical protein